MADRLCCYFAAVMDQVFSKANLARRLLTELESFRVSGTPGVTLHAAGLFSYCALSRERLMPVRLRFPVVGIVLSGCKEIWRGEHTERMDAGSVFVLPANVELDIVNEPDPRVNVYQSLIMEIEPDKIPDLPEPDAPPGALCDDCAIPLTPGLVDAVLHAARKIAMGPAAEPVRTARLLELFALLRGEAAARPLFRLSVPERVARTVRAALDRPWTAADVARRLAMSESTLRRRLADEGQSFSVILRRERMQAARRLIAKGVGSGVAAASVGYSSRAHFAEAFRATFGDNPSDVCPSLHPYQP
ncbi:helix-turn-helix domain-containing protein [Ciceribacter sp. L1K23]|uniref:helix-turn-helix transcriptional regulator n=1 Tax=Ciceribacter sp. L1K23 TaxID=2820276 RepID=UPI001B8357D9|nr:helix-turn-helix domain-containing protein [Ciceribacter sp. L1K23]